MKFLFALATAAAVQATPWHQLDGYTYADYMKEFNKTHVAGTQAYIVREAIFNARLANVMKHNADETQTWKQGVNQFTDRTTIEHKRSKGYNKGMGQAYRNLLDGALPRPSYDLSGLPAAVDWREKKVVTPVKNQGGCGSCWAFAATETLESHHAIKTGKLPVLAPQEFVDCVPNPKHCGGTGGCEGATAQLAYDYIKVPKGPGQCLEADYPYTGQDGTCQHHTAAANVTGHTDIPSNDHDALMAAVATKGPISISVDASFMAYESGVFSGCSKDADIDHAVQLVGYGTQSNGGDYWLVRNSWGEGWGEAGYIKIQRFATSQDYCGTDNNPGDGSGCQGGPATVPVCGMCGILYDNTYPTL